MWCFRTRQEQAPKRDENACVNLRLARRLALPGSFRSAARINATYQRRAASFSSGRAWGRGGIWSPARQCGEIGLRRALLRRSFRSDAGSVFPYPLASRRDARGRNRWLFLAPLAGCWVRERPPRSGGLRFATTTGYQAGKPSACFCSGNAPSCVGTLNTYSAGGEDRQTYI